MEINTLIMFWIDEFALSNVLLKEIFSLEFWDVTSWYQSLGLRDSGILSGVPELKLRGRVKSFQKVKRQFCKKNSENEKQF